MALLLPRTALALDTEPNDSCASGETVSAVTFADGELSSSSDVDAFLYTAAAGTFAATLLNVGNTADDFVLSLYDSTGSTLLGSSSSSGGRASVSYGLSAQTTLCARVSGSAGAYTLGLDELADAPSLTDVWDSRPPDLPLA